MKTLKPLIIFAALAIMIGACSYNPNNYSCFADIAPEGWKDTVTFTFTPEIEDSIATGTLNLLVRNTNDYPYSNLWIEIESREETDSGLRTRPDTVCIQLADIYGNWHGSGIGTSYQLKRQVYSAYTVRKGDSIRIRHIMRPTTISGLEQIGIIFEVNEK